MLTFTSKTQRNKRYQSLFQNLQVSVGQNLQVSVEWDMVPHVKDNLYGTHKTIPLDSEEVKTCHFLMNITVVWLEYCRYGVKHKTINQPRIQRLWLQQMYIYMYVLCNGKANHSEDSFKICWVIRYTSLYIQRINY